MEPGVGAMGDGGDWNNIKYFDREEFVHRPRFADNVLVRKLDMLRGRITDVFGGDVYVIIHVCAGKPGDHAEGSYHYPEEHAGIAKAADFHFDFPHGGHEPAMELACILECGFTGIGYYPGWGPIPGWHLDVRAGVDWPVYWTRDEDTQEYDYGLEYVTNEITDVLL